MSKRQGRAVSIIIPKRLGPAASILLGGRLWRGSLAFENTPTPARALYKARRRAVRQSIPYGFSFRALHDDDLFLANRSRLQGRHPNDVPAEFPYLPSSIPVAKIPSQGRTDRPRPFFPVVGFHDHRRRPGNLRLRGFLPSAPADTTAGGGGGVRRRGARRLLFPFPVPLS
jgi:hypothetical protein